MEFTVNCLLAQGGGSHWARSRLRCGDEEGGGGSHTGGAGAQSGGLHWDFCSNFPELSRVPSGFWPGGKPLRPCGHVTSEAMLHPPLPGRLSLWRAE